MVIIRGQRYWPFVPMALQECSVKEFLLKRILERCASLFMIVPKCHSDAVFLSSVLVSFQSHPHTHTSPDKVHTANPPGCSSPSPTLPPSLSLSVHLPLLLILSLHLKEQCTNLMFQLKGITSNKKKTNLLNQGQ